MKKFISEFYNKGFKKLIIITGIGLRSKTKDNPYVSEDLSILKNSMRKFLPKKIIDRKDKMGFPVPLNDWMKAGEVRDFVHDTLFSKSSLERGIYKKEALKQILGGQGVGARPLWGALSLELWHQKFIDAN